MARRARRRSPEPESSGEPIAAEEWGEVIEAARDGTVDGDYNGAPELAAVESSLSWEGRDAVDAAERSAAGEPGRASAAAAGADLADQVAQRREMVRERLDEARALDAGNAFEAALASTTPDATGAPDALDEDVLRDQLRILDAAIELLERR
jgi:hypothetical protein